MAKYYSNGTKPWITGHIMQNFPLTFIGATIAHGQCKPFFYKGDHYPFTMHEHHIACINASQCHLMPN